ncbi:MAG TPA: DegV family protein [Bacillota bacterium]|nr:DegV family protein [Bacillota bacterium]
MNNIQLMADGGADVSERIKKTLDLIIVPLYLHFDDAQYISDVDMNLSQFYKEIRTKKKLPRTSAPSPKDFYEAFKKVDPNKKIIMLSLTKGLSSTYENAVSGMNLLLEEEPNRFIEVINTKTASCGIGLLLHETHAYLRENRSFQEVVEHIKKRSNETATVFVLKSLDNLIIGGRLDRVKGTIAKTLNIKLLMRGNENGEIEVTEKVRGDKKSIRRFIQQIDVYTQNVEDKVLTVTHCNAKERAKAIIHEIKQKYSFKDVFLSETGPLISTYAGEGALVMSFFKN